MEQKDLLQVLKELTLLYYQGELTEGEFNSTKELLLATLRSAHPSWTLDELMLAALDVPVADTLVPVPRTSADNVGEAMGDLLRLFESGDLSDEEYQLTTELLLNHIQRSHSSLDSAQAVSTLDPTVPILPHLAHITMHSPQDKENFAAYYAVGVGHTLLGRYHLQTLLGQGTTGQVFLCTDQMREGTYALKLIHPHLARDEGQRQRFMKELHSAERLAHPGIVRTFNLEEDPKSGVLFYTMEFVEGETLDTTLVRAEARGEVPLMPLAWSWQLLAELTHILEYIHARGLVYRDLKPSNVMITPDGYIKLTDFAIAESLDKTAVGPIAAFAGLGYYMAPEQQRGKGEVLPAADVFSLGVLAYQLLTGELPIGRVQRPTELWPALALQVDEVLLRAMDPKASRRYPHPRTFWQALSDALAPLQMGAQPMDIQPPLTPYPRHMYDSHGEVPSYSFDPLYPVPYPQTASYESHAYGSPASLVGLTAVPSHTSLESATQSHSRTLSPDQDPEEKMPTEPELPAMSLEGLEALYQRETPTQESLDAALPLPDVVQDTPSASQPLRTKTPRPSNDWFSPPVALLPATTSGDALVEAPRTPPPQFRTTPGQALTAKRPMAPPATIFAPRRPVTPLPQTPAPTPDTYQPTSPSQPQQTTPLPLALAPEETSDSGGSLPDIDVPAAYVSPPTPTPMAAPPEVPTPAPITLDTLDHQAPPPNDALLAARIEASLQVLVDSTTDRDAPGLDLEDAGPEGHPDQQDERADMDDGGSGAELAAPPLLLKRKAPAEEPVITLTEANQTYIPQTQADLPAVSAPLAPEAAESTNEEGTDAQGKGEAGEVSQIEEPGLIHLATPKVPVEEETSEQVVGLEEAFITLTPKQTPAPPSRLISPPPKTPPPPTQAKRRTPPTHTPLWRTPASPSSRAPAPPAHTPLPPSVVAALAQTDTPALPPPPEGVRHRILRARSGQPLLRMLEVPAGPFVMGSRGAVPLAYRSERPQRMVHLSTYWISQTPITNAMWRTFVNESHYSVDHPDYLRHWRRGEFPNDKALHPVVYIDRQDLDAFCAFYQVNLPTEAQWEKAARGNDGQLWPWGDQKPHPSLSNFLNAKIGDTTPVTAYPKGVSPYGLLDCSGNVWELCADNWDLLWLEHMGETPQDPFWQDPNSDSYTMRGGYFNYHGRGLRCAFRFNTSKRDLHIGARIAQPC